MREALKIVGFCILASVVYGVLHDQVTARICVEYFTDFHPIIIDTRDPFVLALVWGVIATWWVGLILGILLAASAQAGTWEKLSLSQVRTGVIWLLGVMAIGAFAAGVWGSTMHYWFSVVGPPIEGVSASAFNTCLFAHNASYLIGGFGGLVLCSRLIYRRSKLSRLENTQSA
jgi:hypothetical protein